jgi:predicted kinase
MAKRLIVLSGLSGSGKTYARVNTPELKDIPYMDMAEIYLQNPDQSWGAALNLAFSGLEKFFYDHDTLILEGYFLKGSASRQWVEWMCTRNGWEVEYHEFMATYKECRERILAQEQRSLAAAKSDDEREKVKRFTEARLRLLEKYNE